MTPVVPVLGQTLAHASQALADARRALASLPALAADVPVDPDGPEAARWAEAELSDPIYHQRQSLLQRALEWVLEQLTNAEVVMRGVDPRVAAVAVAVLVITGGLVAWFVAGPLGRSRRTQRSAEVFRDDTRTAAELRGSADDLASRGRWTEAVLDRFRALLRSLEERALLDERPGRTAHEAAYEAGARIPSCAEDLHRAGRLFDDLCYGDAVATADDDIWLRQVDTRVAAGRPALPSPAAEDLVAPR